MPSLINDIYFYFFRSADANKSSVLDDFFGDSFPYQGTSY